MDVGTVTAQDLQMILRDYLKTIKNVYNTLKLNKKVPKYYPNSNICKHVRTKNNRTVQQECTEMR